MDTGVSISREPGEGVKADYTITPSGALDANYTMDFVTAYFEILEDKIPEIILNGVDQIIDYGTDYIELGATADDDLDGNITDRIITGGDVVDPFTLGLYIITYNVEDSKGKSAVERKKFRLRRARSSIRSFVYRYIRNTLFLHVIKQISPPQVPIFF